MGFFSKLFGKKEETYEPTQPTVLTDNEPKCSYCGLGIAPTQKVKTFDGKKWHLKPCFRNLRKEAKHSNIV